MRSLSIPASPHGILTFEPVPYSTLSQWYVTRIRAAIVYANQLCAEQFGMIDHTYPNVFKDLLDIFETGLAINPDAELLGYRPQVSASPPKFADHYVWQTYAQVDVKRRAVGSALHAWFKDGSLGGHELDTVGIWSINRPGASIHTNFQVHVLTLAPNQEWQLVDLALHAYKKVGVSLYDTLGKDSVGAHHVSRTCYCRYLFLMRCACLAEYM